MSFKAISKEMNNMAIVECSGIVNSSTSRQLEEQLQELLDKGQVNLVINLLEVVYLSATGLRTLVAALKSSRENGGDTVLVVRKGQPIEGLLVLAGLDNILKTYEDEVLAVAELGSRL